MRRMFQQALLVLAMAALPALGADNSLGTWTVSIAKSTYTPQPIPFKSYTMKREAAEGGVKVTISGERPRGAPIKASYTAKFDGSTSPISGSGVPYNSISVKQVNASTFTYELKSSTNKYDAIYRLGWRPMANR